MGTTPAGSGGGAAGAGGEGGGDLVEALAGVSFGHSAAEYGEKAKSLLLWFVGLNSGQIGDDHQEPAIVAIDGPAGAGKSTVARCVVRLIAPKLEGLDLVGDLLADRRRAAASATSSHDRCRWTRRCGTASETRSARERSSVCPGLTGSSKAVCSNGYCADR